MFKDAGLKTCALTSCDGLTSFSLPGVEEFTANAVGSVTKLKYFLCWFGLCGVLVSHGMTGMQLSNRNHKNTLIEIFPCCLRLPTFPSPSFCQIPVAPASCVTLTAVTHPADVLQAALRCWSSRGAAGAHLSRLLQEEEIQSFCPASVLVDT